MNSKSVFIFCLFFVFSEQSFDANQAMDYEEDFRRPNSVSGSATALLRRPPKKSIYISPDLDDILDQQSHDVYHDVVRGAILMPKVKFSLRDDEDCIRDADDDPEAPPSGGGGDEDFGGAQREEPPVPKAGKSRPLVRTTTRKPVRVFPNPLFRRTIEEMIPFARIPFSDDTYIVMADDPVLAVDNVPKCVAGGGGGDDAKAEATTSGSSDATTGDGTTTSGDGTTGTTSATTETTTEAEETTTKK